MNPPPDKSVILHNAPASRFEVEVEGRLSILDYVRRERELVLTHTFVPPELRGRGLAEKLVRTALDFARGEGCRVVPACSYVDAFLRRHPEYADLRAG